MNCGVGYRCALDLALLWLWHRPASIAPIGPLAWKPPYAMGVALKRLYVCVCVYTHYIYIYIHYIYIHTFFVFLRPYPGHMDVPRG